MQTIESIKPGLETNPVLMSFDEMKQQFPNEWVLVADPVYDEKDLDVVSGLPLLHGNDKKEVYYYSRLKMTNHKLYTIVYTGAYNAVGRTMTGIWGTIK
jgi:outer membrane receptor for ferric coprogen and ferric-rhodotorulic acid